MNVTLERSSCYSQTLLSDWFVAISNYNLSQHHCLYFSWASFDDDDAALLRANGSRIRRNRWRRTKMHEYLLLHMKAVLFTGS